MVLEGMGLHFNFITAFPDYFTSALKFGLVGKALENSKITFQAINPRDFSEDRHQSIDDSPYGGGDGMVLCPSVFQKALHSISESRRGRVMVLTPQGRRFDNTYAQNLAKEKNITFLCGRYSGFDQRLVVKEACEEISIGDYILNGGEVAALAIVEAVSRFVPGVLGNEISAQADSFTEGLLEGPIFTRPENFEQLPVPQVLLSGDHAKIKAFRKQISYLTTYLRRPELLKLESLSEVLLAAKKIQSLSESEMISCGLSHRQVIEIECEIQKRLKA